MSVPEITPPAPGESNVPHRRRPRYAGKNPRRFEDKYKEHDPARYAADVAKVIASGKTPAGSHRPIMVAEILEVLALRPGELAVDCTLGFGGHAREMLAMLAPGGRLIGLDVDPVEHPKTTARLREAGCGEEVFTAVRSNFAGLPKVLAELGLGGADAILADLGVSSMQIDDPGRGFTFKSDGPLDLRLNPRARRRRRNGSRGWRRSIWRWRSRKMPMNRRPNYSHANWWQAGVRRRSRARCNSPT